MSDSHKDEIAELVERTLEGLIEEALVVGDTGYMEFDLVGARGVIVKAISDYEVLREASEGHDEQLRQAFEWAYNRNMFAYASADDLLSAYHASQKGQ